MKDLNKLFKECVDIVTKDCGIEIGDIISVELNYRAKGRFGQCVSCGNGRYKLNFNHLIFDDRSDENAVKETIIHEILHTCKGKRKYKMIELVNGIILFIIFSIFCVCLCSCIIEALIGKK